MAPIALATDPIHALAQEFLSALKMEEPAEKFVRELAELDFEALRASNTSDDARNAFWINVYNGFNLHKMRQAPPMQDRKARMQHFLARDIEVAGQSFSLIQIENGILRRSKPIWGLGYISKPFPGKVERQLRVQEPDPRIHFALNCGALSCPPIRFYHPADIQAQLDLATRSYLLTEIVYEPEEDPDTIQVSSLFRMYPGDFGGRSGARKFIRKYREDLPDRRLNWKFQKWDWTPHLTNFS